MQLWLGAYNPLSQIKLDLTGCFVVPVCTLDRTQGYFALVLDACKKVASHSGGVPGSSEPERGNAAEHNEGKAIALWAEMAKVLEPWTVEMLEYSYYEPK